MKIVEYQVVFHENDNTFSEYINSFFQYGWQPLGAPFISTGDIGNELCQAMVKYEEPPTKEENQKIIEKGFGIKTPEQKFKQARRTYYDLEHYILSKKRWEIDGKPYSKNDIEDIIDQEWIDHLDGESL